ncbi:GNAT family N-acetyltransferase [Parvularcula sp. ZS-1/3]|uniref:GNAT family N-acetyltransferase n=1 Tax=Parvularcula mediterranea TaxID=2732508 RepID=A0A7Y3RMI3_9PROT|nr:GNAT family N-acetyltransferase [Parvularcula mediterranea]NNU16814.1 GNAT family N-acetyltransferase [Parvularcula mediterranea]
MPSDITFARLTEVPLATLSEHLNDPRLAEHMPLLTPGWDEERTRDWVEGKEEAWARDGLGHWAFLFGDRYVGWGGFEKEEGWDFALVLRPEDFGLGLPIASKAIAFARKDPRISTLIFRLATTRRARRALERLGARYAGEGQLMGATFLTYHLDVS